DRPAASAGEPAAFPLVGVAGGFARPAPVRLGDRVAFLGVAGDPRRGGRLGGARYREGAEPDGAADAGRPVEAGGGGADRAAFAFAVGPGGDVVEARRLARVRVERRGGIGDAVGASGERPLRGDDRRGDRGPAPGAPAGRAAGFFGGRVVHVDARARIADRGHVGDRASAPAARRREAFAPRLPGRRGEQPAAAAAAFVPGGARPGARAFGQRRASDREHGRGGGGELGAERFARTGGVEVATVAGARGDDDAGVVVVGARERRQGRFLGCAVGVADLVGAEFHRRVHARAEVAEFFGLRLD